MHVDILVLRARNYQISIAGEEQGVHYHFVDKPDMEKEISEGKLLEHANVHGNLYGTSFDAVSDVSKKCVICILDIDIQGVKSCRKRAFDGLYIFVAPPTIADLEKRLVHRGTETPDRIKKRVENAVGELDESKRLSWDEYIVNDNFEEAYAKLTVAIKKAREDCALYRTQQKSTSSS
jgi:guanylate kinase